MNNFTQKISHKTLLSKNNLNQYIQRYNMAKSNEWPPPPLPPLSQRAMNDPPLSLSLLLQLYNIALFRILCQDIYIAKLHNFRSEKLVCEF